MNWGEIKSGLTSYLEAGSTSFIANIPLFCRLAEEDIYREVQLPMTRITAWTNVVLGNRLVALPSDYLSTYSLAINVSGEYVFLQEKEPEFLREAYPLAVALAQPRYYSVSDEDTIVVAPTPDQNYLIEMQYFSKVPSLSLGDSNSNNNWLSENGENAILFGILYHGYIFEKGDQDVITHYKEQFAKAVGNLKQITEGRQKKDTYRTPDQRMQT